MRKLRNKLAYYNEIYFLIYISVLNAMYSFGEITSLGNYFLYKTGLVVAFACLGLKILFTNYTKKELLLGTLFFVPLLVNFIINKDLFLFMFAAGMLATKNINLDKIFKQVLWIKIGASIITWIGVLSGVLANEGAYLPKNGVYVSLKCYGYLYPNVAYANLLSIAILLVIVYYDKLKWYYYILLTIFFYGMYALLYCRTGFIVWILLCILVFIEKVIKNGWIRTGIYRLMCLSGFVIPLISIVFPILFRRDAANWLNKLNHILTGRIEIASIAIKDMNPALLGQPETKVFDNVFVHVLYNNGFIFLLVVTGILCLFYAKAYKTSKNIYIIMATVILVYAYMEFSPLTLSWCPCLLILSKCLWNEDSCKTKR